MSGYIQAHKLNRRFLVQERVPGADELGQPLNQWRTIHRIWCHAKVITGASFMRQEYVAAEKEISQPTASFRTRKPETWELLSTHRLVERVMAQPGNRVLETIFEIRVVLPDKEDDRYLDVGVATGANDG